MKTLNEYINESNNDKEILDQYSLVKFISLNKDLCKGFVRDCRKQLFDDKLVTSKESLSNLTQDNLRSIKQILDKNAKKYFKVSYSGLEKKCKGLSNSLFTQVCSHIMNNVIDNDTEKDWPAIYTREI